MTQTRSLSAGIFFEDMGVLLPWNCTTATARFVLGLEDYRTDPRTLVWEDRRILGGLPCDIYGKFVRPPSGNPAEPRRLRYMHFFPILSSMNTTDAYERMHDYLVDCFGLANISSDGEGILQPYTEWKIDDVMVVWKVSGRTHNLICAGELWKLPVPKGLAEHTRME